LQSQYHKKHRFGFPQQKLVKDGKVHFIYHGKTMHYLRYDLATGKKDVALDGK